MFVTKQNHINFSAFQTLILEEGQVGTLICLPRKPDFLPPTFSWWQLWEGWLFSFIQPHIKYNDITTQTQLMLQCHCFLLQYKKVIYRLLVTRKKLNEFEEALWFHVPYFCALSYIVIFLTMTIELKIRQLINTMSQLHVTLSSRG